jgi:hypothetical protein
VGFPCRIPVVTRPGAGHPRPASGFLPGIHKEIRCVTMRSCS